jgi:hypothetical protein
MGIDGARAQYSYPDNLGTLDKGTFFYRLRAVDIDGEYQYSATRVIRLGSKTDNSIAIHAFPNPVNTDLQVTIPAGWQKKQVRYELVNMNGQVATRKESRSSSQTETINMSGVQSGVYFMRVIPGEVYLV